MNGNPLPGDSTSSVRPGEGALQIRRAVLGYNEEDLS